jgi:hypothetical protein
MSPTPTALGMHLCEQLIVEEHTRRVSLINCFTALPFVEFPTGPRPFWIFADLTDGSGSGDAEIIIANAATGDAIHAENRPIRFSNRLQVVQFGWRVSGCRFPSPGRYYVTLRVDAEWVAQRWVDVKRIGSE